MNDEELVEVIAEWLGEYEPTRTPPRAEASDLLAALRSAGFQVFRPETSAVRYMGEWDEWLPIYDQLPVVTRASLAHLHGRHDDSTTYCPLCGFDPDTERGSG